MLVASWWSYNKTKWPVIQMLRLLQTCTFGCHWAAPWSPSASSPASLTHSTRGSRQTSHRCPSQATLSLWKQSWFHSWSWCWRPPMLIVLLPCARKVVSLGLYLAGPPLSGWEVGKLKQQTYINFGVPKKSNHLSKLSFYQVDKRTFWTMMLCHRFWTKGLGFFILLLLLPQFYCRSRAQSQLPDKLPDGSSTHSHSANNL